MKRKVKREILTGNFWDLRLKDLSVISIYAGDSAYSKLCEKDLVREHMVSFRNVDDVSFFEAVGVRHHIEIYDDQGEWVRTEVSDWNTFGDEEEALAALKDDEQNMINIGLKVEVVNG